LRCGLSEVEVAGCGLPRNVPGSSCGLFPFATGMRCGTAICYSSAVEGPTSTTDNRRSIVFRWGGCNEPSIVTTLLLYFFTPVIASVSLILFSAPFRFVVTVALLAFRSPLFHLSLFTFSQQNIHVVRLQPVSNENRTRQPVAQRQDRTDKCPSCYSGFDSEE
jgi:hypothetical protein